MPYVQLPSNPSRDELYAAVAFLEGLAVLAVPGVTAELEAVRKLTRALYPRRAPVSKEPGAARKKPGRRSKRRLVDPEDCRRVCPRCGGRGTLDRAGQILCDAGCQASCVTEFGHPWAGKTIVNGCGEHDPAQTHYAGRLAKGERPVRGEFAQQAPRGNPHPDPLGAPISHRRGALGVSGPMHADTPEVRRLALEWQGRRRQADGIDLAAHLEARAVDAMADMDFEPARPRGRRINGSRREHGILKPGGERRAKMEKRARRYQAELNRKQPREVGWTTREPTSDLDAALALVGIDPKAFREAVEDRQWLVDETAGIAQARRDGDLPPDDLVVQWTDTQPIKLKDGRLVRVEGPVGASALVCRIGTGECVRISGAIRVRERDGSVDILHPDDVPQGA